MKLPQNVKQLAVYAGMVFAGGGMCAANESPVAATALVLTGASLIAAQKETARDMFKDDKLVTWAELTGDGPPENKAKSGQPVNVKALKTNFLTFDTKEKNQRFEPHAVEKPHQTRIGSKVTT